MLPSREVHILQASSLHWYLPSHPSDAAKAWAPGACPAHAWKLPAFGNADMSQREAVPGHLLVAVSF